MTVFTATLLTLVVHSGLLPFSEDVIRVKAAGRAEVFALKQEVHIAGAAGLAKQKWRNNSLCPRIHASGKNLILECSSARLHASSDGATVTVHALRGLPWDAEDVPAPRPSFAPESVGLGGPCPGTTPAGKAECALKEGQRDEAKKLLEEALQTVHRDYAALRLGDLALDDDHPLEAMEWLEKTGRTGQWGRLASVRQCELSGRCFKGVARDALFDAAGMDAPLQREMALRELRLLRFESPVAAVTKLFERGAGAWPDALCGADFAGLCHQVLLGGLASSDTEARITALTLFASGPVTQASEKRPMLADAAADAAVALGASQYAAAALAAATGDVKKTELTAHLRKVYSLYLSSGQPERAQAVLSYALDNVGPQARKWKPGPSKVRAAAGQQRLAAEFPLREAELATELASAALTRSRAREAR